MPLFQLTGGIPATSGSVASLTPSVVSYPLISESHVRATYQILSFFFDGTPKIISGNTVTLPILTRDNIVQDIRDICADTPMPVISILDANVLSEEEVHCRVNSVDGYERRTRLLRKILTVVPFEAGNSKKNYREVLRLYDIIFSIHATQHAMFAERNIFNPQMDAIPVQIPHEEFCIASGDVVCEVRAKYFRDA